MQPYTYSHIRFQCESIQGSGCVFRRGSTLGQGTPAPQSPKVPPASLVPPLRKATCSWPFWRDFWGPKMLQNPNLQCSPRHLISDGAGARCPLPRTPRRCWPFGPRVYGSRVQPITELTTLLMIDFKCRPIWSSYFFRFRRTEWPYLRSFGLKYWCSFRCTPAGSIIQQIYKEQNMVICTAYKRMKEERCCHDMRFESCDCVNVHLLPHTPSSICEG